MPRLRICSNQIGKRRKRAEVCSVRVVHVLRRLEVQIRETEWRNVAKRDIADDPPIDKESGGCRFTVPFDLDLAPAMAGDAGIDNFGEWGASGVEEIARVDPVVEQGQSESSPLDPTFDRNPSGVRGGEVPDGARHIADKTRVADMRKQQCFALPATFGRVGLA